MIAYRVSQSDPGEIASKEGVVYPAEEEFRTGSSKLESEDRRCQDAFGDESFKHGGCIIG